MKVLITGLTGFTGQYLKLELESCGHTVIGLNANLLDLTALEHEICQIEPDAVIHLAGIAFVGHGNPNDFYHVNLLGSRNLLAALATLKVLPKCVLLASSANVYGNTKVSCITEETPVNPLNDYAVSKLAMEYMAHIWSSKLPIVIARPFNYTGVGQSSSFLLPKVIDHFHQKAPVIELGNLDVARDFSDVRVVAQIYRRLLETPSAVGEVFNICSGVAYTLNEVLAMATELSGHSIEVRVNPVFVRNNEVKVLLGSKKKLQKYINYIHDIPLKDTLCWMLESL